MAFVVIAFVALFLASIAVPLFMPGGEPKPVVECPHCHYREVRENWRMAVLICGRCHQPYKQPRVKQFR